LITPDRNGRRRSTNARVVLRRLSAAASLLALIVGIFLAANAHAADTITWVQFRAVLMRVDDESPKEWNLWRDTHSKKDEMLLMQWNKRYLRINTKLQEVREIDPQTLVHKDKSVVSPSDDSSAKILATDGWILRDVGTADRIYFELTGEGHKVDINIPHGGR
jgi:hypothetical protein